MRKVSDALLVCVDKCQHATKRNPLHPYLMCRCCCLHVDQCIAKPADPTGGTFSCNTPITAEALCGGSCTSPSYAGTLSATCNADFTWEIDNECERELVRQHNVVWLPQYGAMWQLNIIGAPCSTASLHYADSPCDPCITV